ncbi:DUF2264 domain-containing protein [Deminuibacter soli]|uniref:DUF2264 domain-containing protein n=1 Tax=Deminuibacter soli TaxID=2291815 RepID=A0A3E1NKZ3_9BACT|nr:DUF2264 domain-containing protein [Deminuibacter soli]RFM28577.1 DUF2264 domain-containing protein [Deminuibacter soli]
MKRRKLLQLTPMALLTGLFAPRSIAAGLPGTVWADGTTDRDYWVNLLQRIAQPVLQHMAAGTLKQQMPYEKGNGYSEKNAANGVTYLEAFGRTLSGIAPWLALPDDDTQEGNMRKQLRAYALKGLANAADPASPGYLQFRTTGQPLVDGAFLCLGLLRAPEALWAPLEATAKARLVTELKALRHTTPPNNNWHLFSAMVETFLLYAGEQWNPAPVQTAIQKIQSWYVGDGWYSDGPHFAFDYYNGYVIQPMLVTILNALVQKGQANEADLQQALKRMQRYVFQQERLVARDGTYPAIGRSMPYRVGAFQPMAQLAWQQQLPATLQPAQVRCALTALMKNMFDAPGTFDNKGWLQIGICGHQPQVADSYISTGSLYLCTNGFLPLGLPADNAFWTSAPAEWTAQRLWSGKEILHDTHVDY